MERYTINRVLATALFGDVLLCHDEETGLKVAIKRMHLGAAQDRKTLLDMKPVAEDVEYEAKVNHAVRDAGGHPYILNMQRDFMEDEKLHFVYDFCSEGDLLDKLETQSRFTRDHALKYFREIASAVQHLHSLGFAHRDLSLENVLLDGSNHCRVCDFGLACSIATPRQDCVGKKFYMAPEVLDGSIYDGTKADVWSLGILMFEMLTGAPLFNQASSNDPRFHVFQQVGLRSLLELGNIGDIGDDCVDFLADLLAMNPEDRPSVSTILCHSILNTPSIPKPATSSTLAASFRFTEYIGNLTVSIIGNYFNQLLLYPWQSVESSAGRA